MAGRHGEAIKIRLTAPPVDGAANEELVRFLAEKLAIPRSAIRLLRGQASRGKTLEIDGLSETAVLTALLGPDHTPAPEGDSNSPN